MEFGFLTILLQLNIFGTFGQNPSLRGANGAQRNEHPALSCGSVEAVLTSQLESKDVFHEFKMAIK
jgi:hypothetical protein